MKKIVLAIMIAVLFTACQRDNQQYAAVCLTDADISISYQRFLAEYKITLLLYNQDESETDTCRGVREDIIKYMIKDERNKKAAQEHGLLPLTADESAEVARRTEIVLGDWVEFFGLQNVQELSKIWAETGMNEDIVRSWNENSVIAEKLQQMLKERAIPTEEEVEQFYSHAADEAEELYKTSPKEFFQNADNLALYTPPSSKSIGLVRILLSENRQRQLTNLRINHDDERADQLLEQTLQEIEIEADEIMSLLESGKSFAELEHQFQADERLYRVDNSLVATPEYDLYNVFSNTAAERGYSELGCDDEGYYVAVVEGDFVMGENVREVLLATFRDQLEYQNHYQMESLMLEDLRDRFPYEINEELLF